MPLFPDIEPYARGWVPVAHGDALYVEQSGNPAGKPVVVLHGGPGSGSSPGLRRYFDPDVYRIVLFDQRGCGRSRPHASSLTTPLTHNTTPHLLADIERLRTALEIETWLVFGGSWGSVLGLLYAQAHPERVTGLVLWGVALGNASEIVWMYEGVAPLFPQAWARFSRGASGPRDALSLLRGYQRRLNDPDDHVRLEAAREFHAWEWGLFNLDVDAQPGGRWLNAEWQLARARIITHYFVNNCWLEEGQVLSHIDRLASIPGVLVQGRLDLAAPLASAWSLAQAWPASDLVIVNGAGHSPTDHGMDVALLAATQRFARGAGIDDGLHST